MKKHVTACAVLAAALLLAASLAWAGPGLRPIAPAPPPVLEQVPVEGGNPARFDDAGRLDRLDLEHFEIVIADSLYGLSRDTVYLDRAGNRISPRDFALFDLVGAVIDENFVVRELWKLN